MHHIEDINSYQEAIQLYDGLLDEDKIARVEEIERIARYLILFLNKIDKGEYVPSLLLRDYHNQLTHNCFNEVHGSDTRFFWCANCKNFNGARVGDSLSWYRNTKLSPLRDTRVTKVKCLWPENTFAGVWWYDKVEQCSGWDGTFYHMLQQARADTSFLLQWFLENVIPILPKTIQKMAKELAVTLQDLELALSLTPEQCFRHAVLHLIKTRMTLDEYENAISSGLPRREWPGCDSEIERMSPGHPLGDSRHKRQTAAQFFLLQAHGVPTAITEDILSQLHISVFDCDPAVRQDIVRTLGILQRPESLPILYDLLSAEKESRLVRQEIHKSISFFITTKI
ncbi:MAG: HEAT repeat domain-containing protein [Desulfuromonadaceae bacterium]|nr:HEAT repeat domain-containing protein [Desulfuromonadaceae bacterium]